MPSGFIEIRVRHRRPGRPCHRKTTRLILVDGTRLEFGDRVPASVMRAILEAVLPIARQVEADRC